MARPNSATAIPLVLLCAVPLCAQHSGHQPEPLPPRPSALHKAQMLLREGKTSDARAELNRLSRTLPNDPDLWYQIARSHLLDFNESRDPAKRRTSLSLAMEALSTAIKRDPNHIPSLRAKSVVHARAELLYYDPNLAFELAERVVKIEPNANGYLINLSEWLSGEVRFTKETVHRVPHDPMLGLDRSLDLMERVIDNAMPFSNEESAALFIMAKALTRRGNFADATLYYKQVLNRPITVEQRMETMRELGANYYRLGEYTDAAATFYQILQNRPNSIDQWLLKVSLDQIKDGVPALPKSVQFPVQPKPDASQILLDFKDIAPELGVDRFDGNGTCGWADYDGDGDLDLFLAGSQTFVAVYRNDRGKFREITEEIGLAGVPSGYSLNLVDYDNNGTPDLYISYNGWNGPMPNRLFKNSSGRFTDVSKASGLADAGDGFVSLWGDLDNDGWLDVFIANGVLKDGSTPQIYRNRGDGTFVNMTKAAGIDEPPAFGAIGGALGDYDRDGDLDILINGLEPAPNRLYRNDGNLKFTEVSKQAGVVQPVHNGFVCFFFDFNNDGYPDLLTTSLAPWDAVVEGLKAGYGPATRKEMHPDASRLFRNNKDGTFTDVTYEAGLFYPMGVMGAGVADLDNDGFIDIYFGTGDPQMSRLEPNRLFRNNGNGTFADVTSLVDFARPGNKGHGVSFIDFDGDGDIEVYAQLGGHYPGDMARNAFYRNLKGNKNNWLHVDLRGTKSNRDAIGAELTLRSGDLMMYREVKGSEGFGATSPYRVYFGLGKRAKVDTLEIRWPSGIVSKLANIEANEAISVREGEEGFQRVSK